ncbi:hypothetical protein CRG98_013412 [Punica granatum]|uniref:Uncharacterized protein n=1 Tax=Punica granatum TaxID=22663 RepID=A0A2I0KCI3_PUNGR|nr:hypothetical protein CRG98_013412 [Punica granatum]
MDTIQGNQEISTISSRKSKAAKWNTKEEVRMPESKKEIHPRRHFISILHKNPQALTGASLARTLPDVTPTHAYQESYNNRAIPQPFHGSRSHTRTRRFIDSTKKIIL